MTNVFKLSIQKYFASYRGVPSPCWQNILFSLVNAISVGVCFFLSLYFVDTLHFSVAIAATLMTSYGIGTVAGGILSGKCCDRFSADYITVISLIFQGAGFFLLAQVHALAMLAIILLMLGVSSYAFKTANNVSLLSKCHDNQHLRLKTINLSHVAANFGLGLSGIMIGIIASHGYATIFYIAGSLLLASAIYLSIFISIANVKSNPFILKEFSKNKNRRQRNSKILLLALVSVFLVGMIIAQLGSTYPIYVKHAFSALGIKAVSILFILDTVIIVLFQTQISHFYEKFNTLLVMGCGAFLLGLGMLVLSFSFSFGLALVSCCIWTIGEILFLPTAQLLCYENSNHQKKGQSIGIFQSTYAISTVLGPIVGGYLYSTVGMNSMWHLSFIIGMLCMLSCFMFY